MRMNGEWSKVKVGKFIIKGDKNYLFMINYI